MDMEQVRHIAVVAAGLMGHGIACIVALIADEEGLGRMLQALEESKQPL